MATARRRVNRLTRKIGEIGAWQKAIWFSQMIDSWRIFPRMFLSVYMYLLYYCTFWFMELEVPSLEQSGLISIVVGAGAAWFGLYAGTAKDKINSK